MGLRLHVQLHVNTIAPVGIIIIMYMYIYMYIFIFIYTCLFIYTLYTPKEIYGNTIFVKVQQLLLF